jgi:hypothetical protein
MDNIAVNMAADLSPTVRAANEDMLGRALGDDEQISVIAFCPHAAPTGANRGASAARLRDAMDDLAAKARPVDQNDLEDAFNEAMDYVRPGRG